MKSLPSPHPLDYDWRFDSSTAKKITEMLSGANSVLALGAPTVARLLEAAGKNVTLVDRQPIQAVRDHIVSAVEDFVSEPIFDAAIIDPPWYPTHLEAWTRIAGRSVRIGAPILLSTWPKDTRPSAETELTEVFGYFSTWSAIERNVGQVRYIEPSFESVARRISDSRRLSRSPLRGELVHLRVKCHPDPLLKRNTGTVWHRFVINQYQLAVRLGEQASPSGIRPLPMATGWLWPFVSARATGVENISIWSSGGEVGIVGDTETTIGAIRNALDCQNIGAFEQKLAKVPELLEWRLPRPPYERLIEWQHLQ